LIKDCLDKKFTTAVTKSLLLQVQVHHCWKRSVSTVLLSTF